MDGAIIVAGDGTVEAAAQYVDASAADIMLSKGLGARHWAAAAISRATKAVAVAVSESSGTVRIFQNGEVVLRIEPFRRPMKWKDYEHEPPAASDRTPLVAPGSLFRRTIHRQRDFKSRVGARRAHDWRRFDLQLAQSLAVLFDLIEIHARVFRQAALEVVARHQNCTRRFASPVVPLNTIFCKRCCGSK